MITATVILIWWDSRLGGSTNMAKAWRLIYSNASEHIGRSPIVSEQSEHLFRPTVGGAGRGTRRAKFLYFLVLLEYMGKSPRKRRRFRKYLRGNIDLDFLLGTLAAESLISAVVPDTVVEKAWCSSVRAAYSIQALTKGPTIGPITIGLAHSDYTSAEIEAWVENLGSWDQGGQLEQEIARRKIRVIGTFPNPDATGNTSVLNHGNKFTVKCGWQLITGQTIRFWAYNEGSGALASTDPTVHVTGHANLWPN